MLLLMILFSGSVHGGTTVGNIYYGDEYKKPSSPNLLVGGILQASPNPDANDAAYRKFADQNQAIYVPTYYSLSYYPSPGNIPVLNKVSAGENTVNAAIDDGVEVDKAAQGIATDVNGLTSPALSNGQHYDTVIGYSGGTTSVVTALAEQK